MKNTFSRSIEHSEGALLNCSDGNIMFNVMVPGNKLYIWLIFINSRSDSFRKQSKVTSTIDLVILTLLNITDGMFRESRLKGRISQELEERAERLLKASDPEEKND